MSDDTKKYTTEEYHPTKMSIQEHESGFCVGVENDNTYTKETHCFSSLTDMVEWLANVWPNVTFTRRVEVE